MDDGKLYIVCGRNFMADFIFEGLRDNPSVEFVRYKERKGPWITALKSLRVKWFNHKGVFSNLIFSSAFRKGVKNITPSDRVMLWSIENFKYVSMMSKEINTDRVYSFLWNPMLKLRRNGRKCDSYIRGMKKLGVKVYTFDADDADMLDCSYVPQVHRRVEDAPLSNDGFVFFVGKVKGREQQLAALVEHLESAGVERRFHLVRSKHHKEELPAILQPYLSSGLMSYEEVLTNIYKADTLVEIVQPGQAGITLRALEALFYKKKLITNNLNIKQEEFYSPNNIYVLGDKSEKRTLSDFLKHTRFADIDADIVGRHLVQNWIMRF